MQQIIIEKQISLLKQRFEKNKIIKENIVWEKLETKLKENPGKCTILIKMEESGGEPNVVKYDSEKDEYWFFDCSTESPSGRRSFCYDNEALESRKEHKPKNSAVSFAKQMGAEILTEEQYAFLQNLGDFDIKTSSWLKTEDSVRALGGAIFGDKRFNRMFVYHNGAESYYAARGFRTCLKI